MQHPKVAEAAVVAMPDSEMGQRACAYVVPKRGCTFTLEEMSAYLRSLKVAMFKLPERLELVDALPLAPGGQKVDKKVLEKEIQEKLEREEQERRK